MTILEQIQNAIEEGNPGETEKLVRQAVNQHISAARIVEECYDSGNENSGRKLQIQGCRPLSGYLLQPGACVRALNFWKSRMGSLTGEIWEL